jgi:predicted tellurium resistance membrane protein TerC
MKKRLLIASLIFAIGLFLIAYSALAPIVQWNLLLLGAGIVLLIVGVLLIATELLESLLTRGQRALVDGLQAG